MLVGTGDNDLVGRGNLDGDTVDLGHSDLMRETDIENKLLALFSGTVTYAVDFKLLLVALADAGHHVGDECAGKTVKGLVELGVVGALDVNGRAFDLTAILLCTVLVSSPLAPLTVTVLPSTCTVTPAGIAMGLFPMRDIYSTSLPDKCKDFAADIGFACILVRHNALAC